MKVLVLGGTGTAGAGAVRGLMRAGHTVVCLARKSCALGPGVEVRQCDFRDPDAPRARDLEREGFDAVVSCLASRSGMPKDAWDVDYALHARLLEVFQEAGIGHFVLLSALCVQKPKLAFQFAKRAFEEKLIASGMTYSIVRPTAFFKSLSGQLGRVKSGKKFLVFGDGTLTRCKPISDDDLGDFMARCLTDAGMRNKILPVGGPGPAICPLDQARMIGAALGVEPKIGHVPLAVLDGVIGLLGAAGWISQRAADKAALARIGRYYARESMLVWDADTQTYSSDATPEFGTDSLSEHYDRLARNEVQVDLGAHAVF